MKRLRPAVGPKTPITGKAQPSKTKGEPASRLVTSQSPRTRRLRASVIEDMFGDLPIR